VVSKATSQDVARRAGVSQPTVSRVFTPGGAVSEQLSRKVRKAARELGYRPNTLARSLITGRSRTIGLVVAYFNNPFYAEALEKLSAALEKAGYHILLVVASNQEEEIERVVGNLIAHSVDGIILASISISNTLTTRLREEGLPFVLFNRGQEDSDLSSVTAANYKGGYKAAEFLVQGGHRNIAHISGWQKLLETLRNHLGLSVPDDVSVIGYDDVEMAAWPSFDLTTLRQPATRMVDATVTHLLDLVEGRTTEAKSIEIDSPLILRGSARLPKGVTREGQTP